MAAERPTPPDFSNLNDVIIWQIERSKSESPNRRFQRKCDMAIKKFKNGNPILAQKLIQQELRQSQDALEVALYQQKRLHPNEELSMDTPLWKRMFFLDNLAKLIKLDNPSTEEIKALTKFI